MGSNMEINEKAYTTSEVASMLSMGVTTVRKYAQHLEKSGYEFFKTKNNARLFVERDITALKYLKELRDKTNITVEKAAIIVIEKIEKGVALQTLPTNTPSPPEHQLKQDKQENKQHEELKELVLRQNKLIEELVQRLEKQQEAVNERLNERDKSLMRTINERLETQKQLAASLEEDKEREHRTFFQRLFKRA